MDAFDATALHKGMEGVLAHIIQSFMAAMKAYGLSTPQIHALMYIFHAGECQISDISAMADVSNAAASQLVERLVQQGLVDRREDPESRRNKLVSLSGKGKRMIHESVLANGFLIKIMASLTPEQRQAIHDAFSLLSQTGQQIQKNNESEDSKHAGKD